MIAARPLAAFALGFAAGVAATLLYAYYAYDQQAWADTEEAGRAL